MKYQFIIIIIEVTNSCEKSQYWYWIVVLKHCLMNMFCKLTFLFVPEQLAPLETEPSSLKSSLLDW